MSTRRFGTTLRAMGKAMYGLGILLAAALASGTSPCAAEGGGSDSGAKPAPRPTPGGRFHIILLAGQSNMAGRAPIPAADRRPLPNAYTMDRDDEWVPATAPFHFDRKTAGIGPANQFVRRYLADHPGENVGIVPCAVGGSSISTWDPDGTGRDGANFRRAIARVRKARSKGEFVAILWHQGEADGLKPPEALRTCYPDRFGAMVAAFRKETGDVPVIVGEIGRFMTDRASLVNEVLGGLSNSVPCCACVSSEGLADKGDKVHFGLEGANALGDRYYEAFQRVAEGSRADSTPR